MSDLKLFAGRAVAAKNAQPDRKYFMLRCATTGKRYACAIERPNAATRYTIRGIQEVPTSGTSGLRADVPNVIDVDTATVDTAGLTCLGCGGGSTPYHYVRCGCGELVCCGRAELRPFNQLRSRYWFRCHKGCGGENWVSDTPFNSFKAIETPKQVLVPVPQSRPALAAPPKLRALPAPSGALTITKQWDW